MAKLPNMLSLWNLLVLSLALNVSLILRMVYESEESYKGSSCFKKQGDGHVFHEARFTISSSSSSSSSPSNLANSSCANHPQGNGRVINLDQIRMMFRVNFWV